MTDEDKIKNLFDKEKKKFVKRIREHSRGFQSLPKSYRRKIKRTSAEQRVMDVLNELQIPYEIEFPIQFGNHCKLYDIKILDKNILIEVDGDYWHSLHGDKINYIQLKNKKNDALKNIIAKIKGYKLIRIWEFEINNFREDVVSKIKKEIED